MNLFFRKEGRILSLLLSLFCLQPLQSLAQQRGAVPDEAQPDSTVIWRVATTDDNEFFGYLVSRTDEHIELQTETLGVLTIPLSQIRRMGVLRERNVREGELWGDNPQATRYFVSPNGYGLGAGKGYYQNVWLFFNQFSMGFNDYMSIGLGIVPPFFLGTSAVPVWTTPKLSVPVNGKDGAIHLGVVAFLGTVLGERDGGFGALSGALTLGTRDRNISLGMGFGFTGDGFEKQPAFSVNGMYRWGRKGYVLAETFFVDAEGVALVGLRSVGRNVSFDYGLIIPITGEEVEILLPWLSISVPIGN